MEVRWSYRALAGVFLALSCFALSAWMFYPQTRIKSIEFSAAVTCLPTTGKSSTQRVRACDVSVQITVQNALSSRVIYNDLLIAVYDPTEARSFPKLPYTSIAQDSTVKFPLEIAARSEATFVYNSMYPLADNRRYELALSDGTVIFVKVELPDRP